MHAVAVGLHAILRVYIKLNAGGRGECIKYVDGNMCERTVIKSPEPRLLALLEGSVSGNVLTWQRVGVGLG